MGHLYLVTGGGSLENVDEVRIWNRVSPDDEIKFSMDTGEKKFLSVQPVGKLAFTGVS